MLLFGVYFTHHQGNEGTTMRNNRFRRFIASLAVSTMLLTNITSNVAPLVVYAENAAPVQAEQSIRTGEIPRPGIKIMTTGIPDCSIHLRSMHCSVKKTPSENGMWVPAIISINTIPTLDITIMTAQRMPRPTTEARIASMSITILIKPR